MLFQISGGVHTKFNQNPSIHFIVKLLKGLDFDLISGLDFDLNSLQERVLNNNLQTLGTLG